MTGLGSGCDPVLRNLVSKCPKIRKVCACRGKLHTLIIGWWDTGLTFWCEGGWSCVDTNR